MLRGKVVVGRHALPVPLQGLRGRIVGVIPAPLAETVPESFRLGASLGEVDARSITLASPCRFLGSLSSTFMILWFQHLCSTQRTPHPPPPSVTPTVSGNRRMTLAGPRSP